MDVEARLVRVERGNRLLKGAVLLIAASVGGAILVGRASKDVPDELYTRRMVVVDAAGRERAVLEEGSLILRNAAGKGGMSLSSELGLSFDDDAGKIRTMLNSNLVLRDAAVKTRVMLSDDGSLSLHDAAGEVRMVLEAHPGPTLSLADDRGFRADLGVAELEGKRLRPAASLVLGSKDAILFQVP